jgi:phosphoglucosamine mutase
LALAVAESAARVIGSAGAAKRPRAVLGRDPRLSGEMLEAAVTAGLTAAGIDVLRVGVLPTPAVAFLTGSYEADLGVMLSASHNPAPDNGIKLFAPGGHKLPDEVEDQIEAGLESEWERPTGGGLGRVFDTTDAAGQYIDHLLSAQSHRLDGLRIVVDCANGAASTVAAEAYRRAGAEVLSIHAVPDGLNINEGCGSTHPEDLIQAVKDGKAHIGIAHDGDADRCLAVDENGVLVDGDQIMAILALSLKAQDRLVENTIVATVMSNLGFKIAMQEHGVTVVETGVGDRYVLEQMRARGFNLGGEQSGHVILSDYATTGDGVLTALALMAEMARTGKPLSELGAVMRKLPQVLINVKDVDKTRLDADAAVAEALAEVEADLGDSGRVLLRPSGTEAVIRVMVEAQTDDHAREVANKLADVVKTSLALR